MGGWFERAFKMTIQDSKTEHNHEMSPNMNHQKPFSVVCIPAFNEERTIASVIFQAQKHVDKIIICDDGSEDRTAEISEKLGAIVIAEALKKAGLKPEGDTAYAPKALKDEGRIDLEKKYYNWADSLQGVIVDEVIMGNVVQAGQGQNPARQAAIYAGVPKEVNAFTVNKICASGMKAVALAAQAIKAGDAEVIVAGGIENMSSVPYYVPKMRWGARMFNAELVDGMVYDGLWEIFYNYHMGVTSENIAEKYGITREEQDQFALESNNRSLAAAKNGIFADEIVPVEIKVKRETKAFEIDEHPRETSLELLGKLPTVFKADGGVTAGNASAITDAGAALVVMSADKAK